MDKDWARQLIASSVEALSAQLKSPEEVRILKEWAIVDPADRPDAAVFLKTFPPEAELSVEIMENHASRLRKRLRKEMVLRYSQELATGVDEKEALNALLAAIAPEKEK